VHEPDTRIELRVSSHPLLYSRHSNQYKTNASRIEDCSHLLKTDHLKAIGLIHENQPCRITNTLLLRNVLLTNCSVGRLEFRYRSRKPIVRHEDFLNMLGIPNINLLELLGRLAPERLSC